MSNLPSDRTLFEINGTNLSIGRLLYGRPSTNRFWAAHHGSTASSGVAQPKSVLPRPPTNLLRPKFWPCRGISLNIGHIRLARVRRYEAQSAHRAVARDIEHACLRIERTAGQLVPPPVLGDINIPSGPSKLLTTGGVKRPQLIPAGDFEGFPSRLRREIDQIFFAYALPS